LWDKGRDIDLEDKTSYTTQYQESYLKYVENKYYAKLQHEHVTKPKSIPTNNLFSPTIASRSVQLSHDPYDSGSDDEEYLMPTNVAESTPRRSYRIARFLSATRLYWNSPPD
jgi:hypothetical protein